MIRHGLEASPILRRPRTSRSIASSALAARADPDCIFPMLAPLVKGIGVSPWRAALRCMRLYKLFPVLSRGQRMGNGPTQSRGCRPCIRSLFTFHMGQSECAFWKISFQSLLWGYAARRDQGRERVTAVRPHRNRTRRDVLEGAGFRGTECGRDPSCRKRT